MDEPKKETEEIKDAPTPTEEKTFTQAELDEIVVKRIDRERKKYGDYDDLKSKLTDYEREREEKQRAEMTEIERYKKDIEQEQVAKQKMESELSTLRESVKQERIRNAFITAAQSANIAYVDDAWSLADKSGIDVGDDGKVSGMDAMIATLVESKPFLVAQNPAKPKTIGEPTPSVEDDKRTLEAQLEEARKRKDFSKVVELANKIKGFTK